MRRPRKRSFDQLILENKIQLMQNEEELEKIEKRLEDKHLKKAE